MKIITIGTWTKEGYPIGWHLDGEECESFQAAISVSDGALLQIKPTGEVLVNGVEIVPWTEERRSAIGEKQGIKYPKGLPEIAPCKI